jgi:hypothetical protein
MVYVIHLSDGNGFCKCGDHATLHVKAWDVRANEDLIDEPRCLACYLAWQLGNLLKQQEKGVAA